jgi:ferredoxin, 2Fe-2S
MTSVRLTLADGGQMDIEGQEGESLMRASTRAGVPGIIGECGGEMSCATCHVYVHSPWKERLRRQSPDEADLLSEDDLLTDDSRLSCQIKLAPEIDGLEATVANEP